METISTLAKRISDKTKKLVALREEFDRVDSNNPHRSSQVQMDITTTINEITKLKELQREVLLPLAPEMVEMLQDVHDMLVIGAKANEVDNQILKLQSLLAKARGLS